MIEIARAAFVERCFRVQQASVGVVLFPPMLGHIIPLPLALQPVVVASSHSAAARRPISPFLRRFVSTFSSKWRRGLCRASRNLSPKRQR